MHRGLLAAIFVAAALLSISPVSATVPLLYTKEYVANFDPPTVGTNRTQFIASFFDFMGSLGHGVFPFQFSFSHSNMIHLIFNETDFDTPSGAFEAAGVEVRDRAFIGNDSSWFVIKYTGPDPDVQLAGPTDIAKKYEKQSEAKFEQNLTDLTEGGEITTEYWQKNAKIEDLKTSTVHKIRTVKDLDDYFPEAHKFPDVKKEDHLIPENAGCFYNTWDAEITIDGTTLKCGFVFEYDDVQPSCISGIGVSPRVSEFSFRIKKQGSDWDIKLLQNALVVLSYITTYFPHAN